MNHAAATTGEHSPRGTAGFIPTTLVGGVLFLAPIVVLVALIGKALELVHGIVAPLTHALPMQAVSGIPIPRILAVVTLVVFCFLSGLFAKTKLATRLVEALESAVLVNIPGYSFMKSVGESVVGVEAAHAQEVVLARIEEAWQIAFVVERMREGRIAVYVPGSPNPRSGSVYLMDGNRVRHLNVPMASAVKCIRELGVGADALTHGVALD